VRRLAPAASTSFFAVDASCDAHCELHQSCVLRPNTGLQAQFDAEYRTWGVGLILVGTVNGSFNIFWYSDEDAWCVRLLYQCVVEQVQV
jgi:hypothetical protein